MKLNKKEFYEGVMEGLNELIEEIKTGKKTLKRNRLSTKAVPEVSAEIMDNQITFETLFSDWEGEPYTDGEFDWEDN